MVKVIVGMMGSSVARGSENLATTAQVRDFLTTVQAHGVHELDTARVYNSGKSEELLGEVNAQNAFAISTKAPAFSPYSLAEQKILDNCNKSLAALQQDKLDIYYLHGPDRQTPYVEQCKAMNQLYREGKFARFGVCSIRAEEVQEIHDICKREGYILPSVYQGGFSPLHRKAAETLFPTLRKLDMVFYAFSPLAGGMLAKPIEKIVKPEKNSRFEAMPQFGNLFLHDVIIEELRKLTERCEDHGVSVMEATLRWFMHHSPLGDEDGFILGASSKSQIEASLSACGQGPLPADIAREFETMWEAIRDTAPGYA